MSEPEVVAVYADESCLGNGREGENPGGAAALVEYRRPRSEELVRRDIWISEPATTNNRMALRSVIESLRALGAKGRGFRVVFTTDSRYIVDGMSQWVHDWARRGWKRKSGEIENLTLWHAAIAAAAPHQVTWHWVRGHRGHAQNEYANDLAMRAAGDQTASGGLVDSGFYGWLEASRAAGARHADPAPFPDTLRPPSRALPSVEG